MQKTILNVIRLLLLICTICNAYITYLNLYPWMTGDYSAEIQFGTLGCMVLWFVLYCLLLAMMPPVPPKACLRERKGMFFFLPLTFLGMNFILERIFIFCNPQRDFMIMCALLFFWCAFIVYLFYVSQKNRVMIWYPFSLYCTIYAVPGGAYERGLLGAGFILLYFYGVVIYGSIEYIIMLILNHRKWQKGKDENETF